MSINVTIVGGPRDGDEVSVTAAYYGRVHVAVPYELPAHWSAPIEETGISVRQFVMPIRLTPQGYRCYWSERAR